MIITTKYFSTHIVPFSEFDTRLDYDIKTYQARQFPHPNVLDDHLRCDEVPILPGLWLRKRDPSL